MIAQQCGADRLVLKPFTLEGLIDALTFPRTPTFSVCKKAPEDAVEALAIVDPALVVPSSVTEHALAQWERNRKVAWYWVQLAEDSDFNVARLAILYDWTSRHLKHQWTRMFHQPAAEWLHQIRMMLAGYWLWRGETSTDISARLKYRQMHHFSRAFRRFFHVSPAEFGKNMCGSDWASCSKWLGDCSKWLANVNAPVSVPPHGVSIPHDLRLSPCEKKILQIAMRDTAVKHIADALGSPVNTVKTHLKRIYLKLGVHSLAEAINAYANHIT